MSGRTLLRLAVAAATGLIPIACSGDDDPIATSPPETTSPSDIEATTPEDSNPSTTQETTTTVEQTTTTAEATTTTTTQPPVGDPLQYLQSLFSYDLARMTEAAALAADGTPARRYAEFQLAYTSVREQNGERVREGLPAVRRAGETVEVCNPGMACTVYADFTGADGQLIDFTIDGNAVSPRLGPPTLEPTSVGPLTVSMLGSYRTVNSDNLVILFEATTAADVDLGSYSASYITADGQQLAVDSAIGPYELRAGARAQFAIIFPPADPGGRILFDAFDTATFDSLTFDLAVPAA